MATIPPEAPQSVPSDTAPDRESHQVREIAESFGSDAGRYNRARPGYPARLIEAIIAGSPGRRVLDVGCGTGIVGRQFRSAGCPVLGVDPDPRMAEVARADGLEVEVTKFEDWDPAGRQFDAVVAGQAWHWVDPVAGAAQAARALRPGGRLALFWNSFLPPPGLGEAMPGLPGPDRYAALCDRGAEGMRQAGAFGDPERWRFDWDQPYTRDEWLDVLPTFGGINRLPAEKLREMLARTGAAVDAIGGAFTMRYAAVAVTATRLG
jgi:SAM-dependent methyltransferase